jgi:tellurite methyltransferase
VTEPFWEAGYADVAGAAVFGSPSDEVVSLIGRLPTAARVLDVGCGDGRNALFLLRNGLQVTAVDISARAVAKLAAGARACEGLLHTEVADAREYSLEGPYDLIIAHGVLHLMPRADWSRLITRMQHATSPHGYNVVAVFTDTLPAPPDLEPFMLGLFREGELLEQYAGWRIALHRSYVLEDEHPGGIRHRHPVNKIVAQRLAI